MKDVQIFISEIINSKTIKIEQSIHFIWDEFSESPNFISIPAIVEENALIYRNEFLDWTYNVSQKKIKKKSLYNHLMLKDGFPFWWVTTLGQRFNINKCSNLNDVIKTMAFVDYLKENNLKPVSVTVEAEKPLLINFFEQWTKLKGIPFKTNQTIPKKIKNKSVIFYSLYLFRFVIYNLVQSPGKIKKLADYAVFDVFTHLKKGPLFKSNYWTRLIDLLERKKKYVQWNHLYYKTNSKFSFFLTSKKIKQFNSNGVNFHSHTLLEQSFGINSFLSVLYRYNKIKRKSKVVLPYLRGIFFCHKRDVDFSPWLYDQFKESICGQEALKNCFYTVIIENAVKTTHLDTKGIYIQEFQPWEIALTHYWKKANRKPIIGVPHSTIRFWDLRYFFSEEFFKNYAKDIFPDIITVNGKYAKERYVENGYPKNILKSAEALRYLYHQNVPLIKRENKNTAIELLICCDYQLTTSIQLFTLVNKAVQLSKKKISIKVRMHPSFPIPKTLLEQFSLVTCNKDLISALQSSDWVVTSNLSAIAIDAYYQKCNVAQLSDGLYFNLSPLRGEIDDLLFINEYELAKKLDGSNIEENKPLNYFYIDSSLKKFSDLLDLNHLIKKHEPKGTL
jgi:surface carbohydrate biosynthesis protein (TIGR04326 family)